MSRQIALALGLCVGACGIAWAQNHTLRSDHVMINTRSHWNNWNFVSGTLGISATGQVAPVFVPKANNAVLDIVSHIRRANANPEATILDAIEAGSNQADVVNLFDGDETTFWEPDPDSPIQDWWFQVDLGRLINATNIGLKFVLEGEGDPFLQFAVLTADNADPGRKVAGKVPMNAAYRTPNDNKLSAPMRFELKRGEVLNPKPGVDFDGDMVRLVQVVVTESDGARGIEVSEGEYDALPVGERGDVVFYKKVDEGEVEIEEDIFEAINPEARGAIRFYRRERPRLAELEVYELGRNLAQGMVAERNGSAESSHEGSVGNLVDGEGTALTFSLKAFQSSTVTFGERFFRIRFGCVLLARRCANMGTISAPIVSLMPNSTTIRSARQMVRLPPVAGCCGRRPNSSAAEYSSEINRFTPLQARYVRVAYPFASVESGERAIRPDSEKCNSTVRDTNLKSCWNRG